MQCCSPRGHGLGLEAPRGPEKSLGLEQKVLGLGLDGMVLVLRLKSCNFQDLQLFFIKN